MIRGTIYHRIIVKTAIALSRVRMVVENYYRENSLIQPFTVFYCAVGMAITVKTVDYHELSQQKTTLCESG